MNQLFKERGVSYQLLAFVQYINTYKILCNVAGRLGYVSALVPQVWPSQMLLKQGPAKEWAITPRTLANKASISKTFHLLGPITQNRRRVSSRATRGLNKRDMTCNLKKLLNC
jgi:hypothetical protein